MKLTTHTGKIRNVIEGRSNPLTWGKVIKEDRCSTYKSRKRKSGGNEFIGITRLFYQTPSACLPN